MHRLLLSKLEELGLTKKESQVYLSLLQLGSATADKTAKNTSLNRSTAYVIIKKLIKCGLVSQYKDGKKTKFNAESPLNLERLLEQQKDLIKNREGKAQSLIPDLMDIYTSIGERPVVRYFEGKEGLKSVREELLTVKSKEYYAVASIDNMHKLFSVDELNEFSQRRSKLSIKVKLIYTYNGKPSDPIGDQELIQIDAKSFPFDADIYVFDNKISFSNTSGHVGGVIIESAPIAKTMKSMLDLIWINHKKLKT
jgi:sugar-specific transcriptional regulator TrmB